MKNLYLQLLKNFWNRQTVEYLTEIFEFARIFIYRRRGSKLAAKIFCEELLKFVNIDNLGITHTFRKMCYRNRNT